jgi:hypothetical protein
MFVNRRSDSVQVARGEAVITRERDGVQPELAGSVLSFRMHVRRLVAVEAEEEQSLRS